jgi:Protein of unknown function (DUF2852)
MAFILLILGFMWWWPLGLVILAVLIAGRGIGRWHHPQFAANGPISDWGHPQSQWESKIDRMQQKMDRVRSKFDRMRDSGPGHWRDQPSSDSRAFDDYRAETLHRLEDEQREFKEFLERLRFAKDRAELDQFLNERRSKPRHDDPQSQA